MKIESIWITFGSIY